MISPKLESERLLLKNWELKEAKEFVKLAKDPKLIFGDMPFPYLLEHAQFWIKKVLTLDDKYYFAIHEKTTKKIVGFCWITIYLKKNEGLIAYGLGNEARGKGYATEAGRLMVNFVFKKLKLKKLLAETKADNFGSHKVLKKLGFKVIRKMKNGHRDVITDEIQDQWFWEAKNFL
ncbi:GNAT family N-acetyltransferase [archaeon]|jgi:[ribosomal protein S5]-alanine N-acetyltransferase|nr:GNAT family N-acetyltransferase [archaeon]MBT4373664.1 GNAT family N-acetyltransferase [archaeon]MBT4531718.1 GNAT family N-acetyltransferase [archaeon]MBT7001830.1 GNAT family N-acetyltransferase [archaeon]MBT7281815.1 GNAT family N-acetyltransferase [archaeon]